MIYDDLRLVNYYFSTNIETPNMTSKKTALLKHQPLETTMTKDKNR